MKTGVGLKAGRVWPRVGLAKDNLSSGRDIQTGRTPEGETPGKRERYS